jgi:uncharacterized membrane protein
MKVVVFFLIIILAGAAIWYYKYEYKSPGTITEKITVTDTLVIVKDSIINANVFDTTLSGFYQGMLPCKTCEGIQRTIVFSDGDHFKMEEFNWGKGTATKKTEGTWEKEKGKFVLYLRNKAIATYKLVKDSLINIENNGITIPDSMSSQYVLFKKNTAPENQSWKKRKSEGIDIIGNGNEPFWSIEIDNEKLILFKPGISEKAIIVPIERPLITKDSTVYSIVTETGAVLKVSIYSKFCNDHMSDHLYEYKMIVGYKGQTYNGCGVLLNNFVQ